MDILDYLETATRPIASPQEARDVRDELYDHYLRLVEAHLAAGETFDEACALALQALGPAHSIQPLGSPARSSGPITTLLLVGAWLAAAFSFAHPIVFLFTLGLSGAALFRQLHTEQIGALLRRHPALIALATLDGLVVGTYPLWSAGPFSYWAGVATSGWTMGAVLVLMLATPLYLVWCMVRHPGGAFVTAGISSAVFALTGFLSTVILWRLYPVSPSANVDWYTSLNLAGLTTDGTHLLWFAVLWYLGSFAMAALARGVHRQRRDAGVSAAAPL